jgi:hypothetical protein
LLRGLSPDPADIARFGSHHIASLFGFTFQGDQQLTGVEGSEKSTSGFHFSQLG